MSSFRGCKCILTLILIEDKECYVKMNPGIMMSRFILKSVLVGTLDNQFLVSSDVSAIA